MQQGQTIKFSDLKTLFFFSAILTQVQNNLLDVRYSLSRVKLYVSNQNTHNYSHSMLFCNVLLAEH